MNRSKSNPPRKILAGWRLSPELIKAIRREAVEREIRQADLVEERLRKSYEHWPAQGPPGWPLSGKILRAGRPTSKS